MSSATSYAKFLTNVYVMTHAPRHLSESRLLSEDVDLQGTKEKIKVVKVNVLKLAKFFEGEGGTDLKKELEKMANSLPIGDNLIAAAYGGNEDVVKKMGKDFTTKVSTVMIGASSVVNAVVELRNALNIYIEVEASETGQAADVVRSRGLTEEERNMTIGALAAKAQSDAAFKDRFVKMSNLEAGIKKAFIPSRSFKDAFKKGAEAAQSSAGGQAKSKLGNLFASAAKFLVGFFSKPARDSFPNLLTAFRNYIMNVPLKNFIETSDKIKIESGKATITGAKAAAEVSSEVAAVAGGAPVEKKGEEGKEGKEDKAEKKPVSEDEINKIIDDWSSSLSKSAQRAISSKKAQDNLKVLKDDVKEKLDTSDEEKVEEEVKASIDSWISEREEDIKKSKLISNKALQDLRDLAPKFVELLKNQKKESSSFMTKKDVRKFVYNRLDRILSRNHQLHEKYKGRTMNKIKETDVKDKHGNVIVSPGLKVRHKDSQFEYTIDSVVKDKEGKIVVMLKKPEAPRFDSALQSKRTLVDKSSSKMIYEAEPIEDFEHSYYTPEDEGPDDLIAVSEKEFEKEYEIR